jgi:malate dehydrogenase
MKISIFGAAGTVGSCAAFAIASGGFADEIVMLDMNKDLLNNHVIDISTAAGITQDMVVRAGNNEDLAGTDIAIIAAGIHFPASTPAIERLERNLPIIIDIGKNIKRYCPGALVITATNPIDLFNFALYSFTGLQREKLIGYNLNDSIRFRIAAAKALGVSASKMEGMVFGEHPAGQVMLFSTLKCDGKPVAADAAFKKRFNHEIEYFLQIIGSSSPRTAGWTTGAGLASVAQEIIRETSHPVPCSVIPDGEYGYRSISIGLAAIINKKGIVKIPEMNLSTSESEELNSAAISLQKGAKTIIKLYQHFKS